MAARTTLRSRTVALADFLRMIHVQKLPITVLDDLRLFASSCLLEGATWRNAAGEEPTKQVLDDAGDRRRR